MSGAPSHARAWVLAKRPARAVPERACFALRRRPLRPPAEGELQIAVDYFSLDAGMRPILSRASYRPALKLGEAIEAGGVGTVQVSRAAGFAPGDKVMGAFGWREGLTIAARRVQKLPPQLYGSNLPWRTAIGVLGVSGLTAYFGLRKHAALAADETLLISSAAGAVGKTAGQIAKLLVPDLRVIGIASRAKLAGLKKAGFDAVIPRGSASALRQALRTACPDGVDVYFDNVGGAALNAIIAQMNRGGRIIACGAVSQYHAARPLPMHDSLRFITHRLQLAGFVVYDYAKEFPAAQKQMAQWIKTKQLFYEEVIFDGLAQAPQRYAEVLRGKHVGRALIRVGATG